jgi:hypothetical protein
MEELPFGTDSKLFTAPGAPAREHSPTVLSLHPGKKTVCLDALAIIRLIGALRHSLFSIRQRGDKRQTGKFGAENSAFRLAGAEAMGRGF